MKAFSLVVVGTGLLLLAACGRSITEEQARQDATKRFGKVSFRVHMNPSLFEGPLKTEVGGAAFAYQWKDKTPGSDFVVLVAVTSDGEINDTYRGHLPGLLPDTTKLPPQ